MEGKIKAHFPLSIYTIGFLLAGGTKTETAPEAARAEGGKTRQVSGESRQSANSCWGQLHSRGSFFSVKT